MDPFDLTIIGGGPGGYVAAIRAAQLGLRVACIDEHAALGGTCLRVGCIPSKVLLESSSKLEETRHGLAEHGIRVGAVEFDLQAMLKRKDKVVTILSKGVEGLFRKHGVTRLHGRGRLAGPGAVTVTEAASEQRTLATRWTLLAPGSRSAALPGIPFDGERVISSTEALALRAVPQRLVVVGAGSIGLELGSVWRRLGAQVTVIELLERILPGMDGELAAEAQRLFARQGLAFRLGVGVSAVEPDGDECRVVLSAGEPLACDQVLVAVGRQPNTDDLGLESVGARRDGRGRIIVGAHFEAAAGVYAVGDAIAGPMLAHKAEEEGIACVEHLATGHGHVDHDVIPGVCYTHPEVAMVGRTEEQLQAAGVAYRKGVFPFLANGRARSLAQTDGKVKILADTATDRVLGVHILGPGAAELIAEAAAALSFGARSEDLARLCHAHPTLAEAVKEAALAVDGRALHV